MPTVHCTVNTRKMPSIEVGPTALARTIIGVILGGYAYPPLFGVGGTVPPTFWSGGYGTPHILRAVRRKITTQYIGILLVCVQKKNK